MAIKAFKRFTSWLFNLIPGGQILWAVVLVDLIALHFGGLMATAVIAGIGSILSFTFIFAQAPESAKQKVTEFCGKHTSAIDLIFTVGLTAYGFVAGGVTMAITALFVGVNMSANLAYLKWSYDKTISKTEKVKLVLVA